MTRDLRGHPFGVPAIRILASWGSTLESPIWRDYLFGQTNIQKQGPHNYRLAVALRGPGVNKVLGNLLMKGHGNGLLGGYICLPNSRVPLSTGSLL